MEVNDLRCAGIRRLEVLKHFSRLRVSRRHCNMPYVCSYRFFSCRTSTVVDKDKEEVTEYFNNNGFERWNKIYSESDEVNDVQRDIRTGHGQTIDKVLYPYRASLYFDHSGIGLRHSCIVHLTCRWTGSVLCRFGDYMLDLVLRENGQTPTFS